MFYILANLNLPQKIMNNFSIHHQLTLKEYRKIYYSLLYRKVFIIVISVFSILFIISTCILWINKNYDILNSDYYIYGIAIAALAIWIPLTTLYTLKRNYKSTYGLHEPVTYSFSDEGYSTIGESFSSKSDWTKIYKVKIIKAGLYYIIVE